MRWSTGDRGNIEDMRGRSGGGGMIPLGIGGIIVVGLLSMFTGIDFFSILGGGGGGGSNGPTSVGTSGRVTASPGEEKTVDMVDAVARDVQQTWQQKLGNRYEATKVVLFRDSIPSACGFAGAATGPFYCPGDHKV
jgi:predicted metalloprotease